MLAWWYATADCVNCEHAWGGKHLTPCESCQPYIHEFNKIIVDTYRLCHDQVIAGAAGPVGLNAFYVDFILKEHFQIEDYVELSLSVRQFFGLVQKYRPE